MLIKKLRSMALLALCTLVLSGSIGMAGGTVVVAESATATESSIVAEVLELKIDEMDLNTNWDASATSISLDDSEIEINGGGATASDSIVTITDEGTYVVTGTLEEGQLIVDAGKKDEIHIVLNGVDISASQGPAIYIKHSDKAVITLAEGSVNQLKDGSTYSSDNEDASAALFSSADLTINGDGSLSVNGQYENGIETKDDLVIVGGMFTVKAVKDGVRGKDSISATTASFTIDAGGDGLKSNNDESEDKGWIMLEDCDVTINSVNDSIQAETALKITGGNFMLVAGGGSENGAPHSEDPPFGPPGEADTEEDEAIEETENTEEAETTETGKGLKAEVDIYLADAFLNIDSSDDTIHSNGNLEIAGGQLSLASGDDGLHGEETLTVNGGSVDITKSYEGIEGASIIINGGTVNVVASDDGMNAAGGSDDSESQDPMGGNPDAVGDYVIEINGGDISVDAEGDGIDSNGNMYFNGGTVCVSGPVNGGNGALDYNGTCEVTGGTLSVAGSSGMAQAPEDTSTQKSVMVYFTEVQPAGTTVSLKDSSGNEVVSYTPSKVFQTMIFSSADLIEGEAYILCTGADEAKCSADITLSEVITYINEEGTAVDPSEFSGPGGDHGPGDGHKPGDGWPQPPVQPDVNANQTDTDQSK